MEQLLSYIQNQRQQGVIDETIKQQLLNAGWDSSTIANAFASLKPSSQDSAMQSPKTVVNSKALKRNKYIYLAILIMLAVVIGAYFLTKTDSNEAENSIQQSTELTEQIDKEPGVIPNPVDELIESRIITNRKVDVGRLLAKLESYAGNNNGTYPVSSSSLPSDILAYIDNSEDLLDPITNQEYLFVEGDPLLGQMQYLTGAKCDNQGVNLTGFKRSILIRTLLDDNTYYCQDNN